MSAIKTHPKYNRHDDPGPLAKSITTTLSSPSVITTISDAHDADR